MKGVAYSSKKDELIYYFLWIVHLVRCISDDFVYAFKTLNFFAFAINLEVKICLNYLTIASILGQPLSIWRAVIVNTLLTNLYVLWGIHDRKNRLIQLRHHIHAWQKLFLFSFLISCKIMWNKMLKSLGLIQEKTLN